MSLRSASLSAWPKLLTGNVPRSRLVGDITRRHVFTLLAMVYVAVLGVIYLHALGEIAMLRWQTMHLRQKRAVAMEQNQRLIQEIGPYMSLPYLDRISRGWDGSSPRVERMEQWRATPREAGSNGTAEPQVDRRRDWFQAFHLPLRGDVPVMASERP